MYTAGRSMSLANKSVIVSNILKYC